MTNPRLISMSEHRILRVQKDIGNDWISIEVLIKRDGLWEDKTIRVTCNELSTILHEETADDRNS